MILAALIVIAFLLLLAVRELNQIHGQLQADARSRVTLWNAYAAKNDLLKAYLTESK